MSKSKSSQFVSSISPEFVKQYATRTVPWGPVGFCTFKRTYARRVEGENRTEEWFETIARCVNGLLKIGGKFTRKEAETLYDKVFNLKCSFSGRALWQLGTKTVDKLGGDSMQNCFSGDTEVRTKQGIRTLRELAEKGHAELLVMTGKPQPEWIDVPVRSFGKQKIMKVFLGDGTEIKATPDHEWIPFSNNKIHLNKRIKTKELHLRSGMPLVRTSLPDVDWTAYAHGFVFGDGNVSCKQHLEKHKNTTEVSLFKNDADLVELFKKFGEVTNWTYKGEPLPHIYCLPGHWKKLPQNPTREYALGFVLGLISADGNVRNTVRIHNASCQVVLEVQRIARHAGLIANDLYLDSEISPFDGTEAPLWCLSINTSNLSPEHFLRHDHKEALTRTEARLSTTVVGIDNDIGEEEVFCASVPIHHNFVLANGVLTGNCWHVAINHPVDPFCFVFDELMLGGGVGFNIQSEYVYEMPKVKHNVEITRRDEKDVDFIVPDNREGWVELLRRVLNAFFFTGKSFSYSTICIRGKGTIIKSFGGTASGPEDLCNGIEQIISVLRASVGRKLRPIDCLDILNIIGNIVVAGNVRRSAQIALGDMDDTTYLDAKNWAKGTIPNWRAMSNNSVICEDYSGLPNKFWSGYNGDGEPYGLVNLANCRLYGRLADGKGYRPDKDVVGVNPCITGETLVYVADGRGEVSIAELAEEGNDVPVLCLDSKQKPTVRYMRNPRVTGHNVPILKITLEEGLSIRVTPNHKFLTVDGEYKQAHELKAGDGLKTLTRCDASIKDAEFCGESNDSLKTHALALVKVMGRAFSHREWVDYAEKKGLPQRFSKWRMDHLGGIVGLSKWAAAEMGMDSFLDGDLRTARFYKEMLSEGYDCFVEDGRVMVRKRCEICGEDFLVIGQRREQGICSMSCSNKRKRSNESVKTNRIEAAAVSFNHRIVSIEQDGSADVYNGTVDEFHNFFVGGFESKTRNGKNKSLWVNNLQCGEVTLESYESCNLAEIFLPNVEDEDEFKVVAELCIKVTKTISCLPFIHEQTNKVVAKNHRLGVGVTGFLQAPHLRDSKIFDAVYKHMERVDKWYSKVMGVKPSIKLTVVKPSGTLSLLAGVTPGVHPGYSKYHIRRIRMASNDPLVTLCRKSGYHVEPVVKFDGKFDHETMVVSFPIKSGENAICAKDITAIEQLEWAKWLQTYWADNSVSVTVYYKPEELVGIQQWLKDNYDSGVKTVSFLLHSGHGFTQAPYEEITEQRYNELHAKCKPITKIENDTGMEFQDSLECAGGACPIK